MRPTTLWLGSPLLLLGGYLGLWPAPIEPVAWQPPAAPALEGAYALNDRLAAIEWRARELPGPEAITFDASGYAVMGTLDGRIVRASATTGETLETIVHTGGRPLGLEYDPAGRLVVADADLGLLRLEGGTIETLATGEGGVPFRFTDDLDIARDGTIYFTDASSRHSVHEFAHDILEHGPSGRLLAYHPESRRVERLIGGLCFANGVALGPDERFVVVVETASYRVTRRWLRGPKAGTSEVFIENLPGFPDNITYSPNRRVFWLAIGSPRDPVVDMLGPWPWLRKVISRLPKAIQPAPQRHAFVLALDEEGRPVESLQHHAPSSYSPIASVIEHDGWLYLGSFVRQGHGRLKL